MVKNVDNNKQSKSVVLIGSSGGGMATLGDSSTWGFVETISRELSNIGGEIHLREVIFVSLPNGKGMDYARDSDEASLFHFSEGTQTVTTATLKEINEKITTSLDESIANDMELNKVHGVIAVSCKPSIFQQTLEAAGQLNIPVTGTGGTSLSIMSAKYGVQLWGNAGGSVGTTPLTKAISFSQALAKAWGLPYRPWLGSTSKNTASWRSVLNACIPAFWAVVLCKRIITTQANVREWVPRHDWVLHMLQSHALPMTCAVVMAHSRRPYPGVLLGAVLAGMTCEKTVLGGLLAGWLVAFLEEKFLYLAILYGNITATMTNLLTTGLVGMTVAILLLPIAPHLATLSSYIRDAITMCVLETEVNPSMETYQILGRCTLGAIFCYGSKFGWYHSLFLPLILIEMELGDPALLGAMDQLTLVLVSAGICSGTLFASFFVETQIDPSLLQRGLLINLICGDFIEACYPMMEKSTIIRFGGYIASSISTGFLSSACKSSAYLPFPTAIWLADDVQVMTLASSMAFGISFLFGWLGSLIESRSSR